MSILINGHAQRAFIFPADINTTFAFFSDLGRIFCYLPHIQLIKKYSNDCYRVRYQSTELGVYTVHIYCDLEAELDRQRKILRLKTRNSTRPVPADAGWNHMTAHGCYSSESLFSARENSTCVDYCISLQAALPLPGAARVMPANLRNAVANSITSRRIREIADGFVARSLRVYGCN